MLPSGKAAWGGQPPSQAATLLPAQPSSFPRTQPPCPVAALPGPVLLPPAHYTPSRPPSRPRPGPRGPPPSFTHPSRQGPGRGCISRRAWADTTPTQSSRGRWGLHRQAAGAAKVCEERVAWGVLCSSGVCLREQTPDPPGASAHLHLPLLSWTSACHLLISGYALCGSLPPQSHTLQEPGLGLSLQVPLCSSVQWASPCGL